MKRLLALVFACAAVAVIAVPVTSSASTNHHRKDSRQRTDRSSCDRGRVCGLDTEYMKESMEGDLFEIRGGQLAKKMSTNPAVLRLANRLIADHSKSYADAVALAKRLGIQVQTDPSPSEQWELQAVAMFKGAQFDHQYSLLEVFDHMQDIDLATHEANDGCAHLIRDNARDELPVLRLHLSLAQEALKASP
jgi:putative membrane protein